MSWSSESIERLLAARDEGGAWGYRAGAAPSAEPTALACLALKCHDVSSDSRERGLSWLAGVQSANGGVPLGATDHQPCWPTALAILAWLGAAETNSPSTRFDAHVQRALGWLERSGGVALPLNKAVFGHDTSLIGWSWVGGTHSWIEPTAYAVRAMHEGGRRDHARTRDGLRLILDRTLPDGGWNYGNTRVLNNTLRPFPATTGIALYALAGEPRCDSIERSIAYLSGVLAGVRAPWSLSWGLIGLSAWNASPSDAGSLLAQCADYLQARSESVLARNVLDDALMLWALGVTTT